MIRLRPATAADALAVAELDFTTRHAAMPTVRWAHPRHAVDAHFVTRMIPAGGVVVAEEDGALVGYMDLAPGWVNQLYVRESHWRRGIGSRLIAHAKAAHPAGLQLYCFQVNARGRAFYERHGFAVARMTDGATNEEREPDILFCWAGA